MSDTAELVLGSLRRARNVLVTTHVRPDGDALGSVAAMMLAMRHHGIAAHALLLSHLPSKYAFVFRDNDIAHTDVEAGWGDFSLDAYDTLLVVDTGTWSQLPGLKDRVAAFKGTKLVVDHHLTQEDWADHKHVVTAASAAGEIVADLLERWDVPLTPQIAGALYLAIVSDTGWFQYSNTGPQTLRLAARLMETGIDTDKLYQALYQNERAERVALQTRVAQSMTLLCDGRLSVMAARTADFTATRAGVTDTEGLINLPLQIRTVQASLLFVEPPDDGPVRVSLRSKGQIDVARFAQAFGGGGHARAAGLKLPGPFEQAYSAVTTAMEQAMSAGQG